MNSTQVGLVLARVQAGDNREIDDEGLVFGDWESAIGELNFFDCIEAVSMHRRESTAYLLAAHVVANVKVITRRRDHDDRVARARSLALSPQLVTLDRAKFDAETQVAIDAMRAAKAARS